MSGRGNSNPNNRGLRSEVGIHIRSTESEDNSDREKSESLKRVPMQQSRDKVMNRLDEELSGEGVSSGSDKHNMHLSHEPFTHPSSPISRAVNDSLTNENLQLLETMSLHLDESIDMNSKGGEDGPDSSFISFPSRSNPNSRANSIVSSAVTAHTNNTTKRRKPSRPRPWDTIDNELPRHDMGKETTPLLSFKTESFHSIKTAKRKNRQHGISSNGLSHNDAEAPSPNLEWKGGVFTETEDNYGTIPSSSKPKGFSMLQLPFMMDRKQAIDSNSSTHPVCSCLIFMTATHFMLMGLYNTLMHYNMHRMGELSPPYWITQAGRIYNPNIGPNSKTLVMFGAFHPILGMKQWWRIASGSISVTCIFELLVNLFLLRIMADYEEKLGSLKFAWIFSWSVFAGALGSIMQLSGFWTVTGLSSPGVMGFMTAAFVYELSSNVSRIKGEMQYSIRRKWSWPQIAILLEFVQSLVLQYVSFSSVIASFVMGIFLGMSLQADDTDSTDLESNASSSVLSDFDDGFASEINTPPRFGVDLSPPPPPSTSSKGVHDTPVIRRSIMSPDEDEEFDMRNSLNAPDGIKKRIKRHSSYIKRALPRKSKRDVFCTETRIRFIGVFGSISFVTVSMLYIGLLMRIPDEQTVSDSIYGCVTMHGLYTYEIIADDDVNRNKNAENIQSGDSMCGEICIPHAIYAESIRGEAGSFYKGSCNDHSYSCLSTTDAFDVGKLEIERYLYTFGKCNNNS